MKGVLIALILCLLTGFVYAEWTIVASYPITGKASGLAYDGTYLYFGIYGADGGRIFQFDPVTGQETLLFNNPNLSDSYGLTYDGQNLWTIDRVAPSSTPAYALKLDMTGNIISQFDLPDFYMSGIAYDDGDFWVMTYYPDPGVVYKVTDTGTILQQFTPPEDQPWDICLQGDDLWIVDYWEYTIHRVDQTGTILEAQMSEIQRPAGIVHDGQYLWYLAGALGQPSTLYKVDLGGTGTPVINVTYNDYDFGNVLIDDTVSADITVSNSGTGDLVISDISFFSDIFATDALFPITLEPTQTAVVSYTFTPDNWGEFIDVMTIHSNDPITPAKEVDVAGYGVFPEAHIAAVPDNYDYGMVRAGADTGRFFTISNQGMTDLQISNLSFSEQSFFIDDTVEFPITLTTREEYELRIWFHPGGAGQITSTATFSSNDPSNPQYDVTLVGTGQTADLTIGTQLWSYQIEGTTFTNIRAIKPIEDIWGNGLNDVIICGEDNYVRAFNGNSSGLGDVIWEQHIPSGAVYSYRGLTIAGDLNGDGYDDVVVGTTGGDRSVRAYSGKTGTQLWQFNTNNYGSGGWVYQVDARFDYNNDGVADVLAATGDDVNGLGPKRIFLINGANGTLIWERYAMGPAFSVIGINDFNGDGIPDVLAGTSNESETQASVFGINGANGNILWSFQPAGSSVWALAQIDDLTDNGIPDVMVGSFMGGGNYYALNATNGEVIWSGSTGATLVMDFKVLGDVNGNGYNDIAVGHTSAHAAVIGGSDGQYVWSQGLADNAWNIDNAGDLTGNGINDLVVGTLYQSNYAYFIDSTDGEILASIPTGTPVDAIGTIGDVTGDNSREMIVGGRNGIIRCHSGGPVADQEPGYIEGNIEISEGPGDVTEVEVSANGTTVNPNEDGDYFLALPPGTYTVTATLVGYIADPVTNVAVVANEVTAGVDIQLELLPLTAPADLIVDVQTGVLNWEMPDSEHDYYPLHYNVYLDDNFIDDTEELTYTLEDLTPEVTYIAGVSAVYPTGESELTTIEFTFEGVDTDDDLLPLVTKVHGNYPNPFNPETRILFSLESPSQVILDIFNIKGERVRRLVNEKLERGNHSRVWNGENETGKRQASGIYFYRFKTADHSETGKMLMLK
jgi:hypothetical protein